MAKAVMDNRIEEMVARFKAQYSTIVPKPGPKFSNPLNSEEEMRAKIRAAFELLSEQRGSHIDWDSNTKAFIDSVVAWIYGNKRWLILFGGLGTGKTTMLMSFRTVFPHSFYCHAKWIHDEFKENERLPIIPDGKLLLLDDLGAEPPVCKIFGEDRTPITDLLLHRYDKLATTVIATNLSINEIQERYGDRLADRIVEMGPVIQNEAPSYRGR